MYVVKGFIFTEKDNVIHRIPLPDGLLAENYDEAHETFAAMGITQYMFRLIPVVIKEGE